MMERWLTRKLFSLANRKCTTCRIFWWVASIYVSGGLSAWLAVMALDRLV